MRTLDAALLATQRLPSMTPYIRVTVTDGVTPYYFDTHGFTSIQKRVISVEGYEEPFGGAYTVRLRNNDQYFADKSLEGLTVTIGWGARTGTDPTVYKISNQAPLFVISQRDVSYEGELATELFCLDYWWQAAAKILYEAGARLDGVVTNGHLFEPGETITGSVSGAIGRLIGLDGEGITVATVSGTFQPTENAVGDSTASVAALTAVTAIPIAGGVSYGKQSTILEIITAEKPASITGVDLDEDDPGATINTVKPELVLPIGTDSRSLIRHLLQMSSCGARLENDAHLHILYLDNAAGSDYIYQTTHVFWSQLREQALIMPNKVTFVDVLPAADGSVPGFSGSAEDSGSVALIGTFETIQVDPTITSDAIAILKATAWIAQRVAEANQGGVRAPMHCGQELYDMVSIVDSRSGVTVTGRVGRIDRVYRAGSKGTPGVYEISIRLGGIMSDLNTGYLGPGTLDANLKGLSTDTLKSVRIQPTVNWQNILPKAIQGYHTDVTFTAASQVQVNWSSGTIKFYDGTTQAISAGNTGTLADTNIRYIYFDLDDATPNVLKVTTDYVSVVTDKTGLLCLVQKGSAAGINAAIIPSYGKQPLITPDFIDMTGLKTYDYGSGATLQAILSTQIQAGAILLSAATAFATGYDPTGKEVAIHRGTSAPGDTSLLWFDTTLGVMKAYVGAAWVVMEGEWYKKTGVVLDATMGVSLYGGHVALRTFATVTAYNTWLALGNIDSLTGVQCYVGTDGKLYAGAGAVILDVNGITINSSNALSIYNGATIYGLMYIGSGAFGWYCAAGIDHYIKTFEAGDIFIDSDAAGVTIGAGGAAGLIINSTWTWFNGGIDLGGGGTYGGDIDNCGDIYTKTDSVNLVGDAGAKFYAGYFDNLPACPVPTVASAIEVIKKIKAPTIMTDPRYGKRPHFQDSDFPDEMKMETVKRVKEKGKIEKVKTGKKEIEYIRTIGVLVQGMRELIDRVEELEAK